MLYKKLMGMILGMSVLLSGYTLASDSCCEEDCCRACSPFDGFYVGSTLGFVSSDSDYTHPVPFPDGSAFTSNFGIQGFDGGVFFGWGRSWNGWGTWYFGVEGVALTVNAKGKSTSDIKAEVPNPDPELSPEEIETDFLFQRARIRDSFQLAVRIGAPIGFAMPYIKLGWNNSHWEIRHRHSLDLLPEIIEEELRDVARVKKRLNAFLFGIGVDFKTSCRSHLVWSLEWTYSPFQEKTLEIGEGDLQPNATVKFKPRYSRIGIRLSYVF
jgi:hypothetical protein